MYTEAVDYLLITLGLYRLVNSRQSNFLPIHSLIGNFLSVRFVFFPYFAQIIPATYKENCIKETYIYKYNFYKLFIFYFVQNSSIVS